jgi:hypothetical protein
MLFWPMAGVAEAAAQPPLQKYRLYYWLTLNDNYYSYWRGYSQWLF